MTSDSEQNQNLIDPVGGEVESTETEQVLARNENENENVFEEKPKIRLTNVPKYLSTSVLRKAVADHLSVPSDLVACRKGDQWNFALFTFKAVGPLALLGIQEIANKLQDFKYKKHEMAIKIEGPRARIQIRKDFDGEDKPLKNINDQVTPLWKVPYEEQLEKKKTTMASVLAQYRVKLNSGHLPVGNIPSHVLEPIKPSPLIKGYRNKCEFTIGWNRESKPTVGFSLGGFRDRLLVVENASECVHVPENIKIVANYFENYLKSPGVLEKYPIYERDGKKGFWRIFMVREHGNALMAVLQVQDGVVADKNEFKNEMAVIFDEFNQTAAVKVESIHVQFTQMAYHGLSGTEAYEHVESSKPTLVENLAGLKFQISPSSFFQVNLPATALLYQTIKEYTLADDKTSGKLPVLLDVCCGTGTIGMIMSKEVDRVIGIEMVESAVEDAKLNSEFNEIKNIEFKCSKVETVIRDVINSIPEGIPIVVVLDPPRSGVHSDVIKTIRASSRIDRVVFVACNPSAAVMNFVDLSRPTSKSYQGTPFTLIKAVPVDMFPQTEHCELVLQFDRIKKSQ
jgi:tRNA (uracil-5-)-methyltransferase